MVKKLIVVIALAFTLALAQPVGEARAATNTAPIAASIPTAYIQFTQAELYGPDLIPLAGTQALPSNWWGWTMCVTSVAAFAAANYAIGMRVAALVKKFGSVRAAVRRAQYLFARMSRVNKRLAVAQFLGAIAAELFGVDTIVDKCFSN